MATKLGLFRAAAIELGEEYLASLTEDRKIRHHLDIVYDDVLAECLQAGDWNFAMKTIEAEADTGVVPNFGSYTEIFAKPSDWVRTSSVSADADFSVPLLNYDDDVNYWATATTPIYVRYISNDASFGLDLTLWPRSFTRYVETALADRICTAILQNQGDKERLQKVTLPRAKQNALNKDAWNEPQKFKRVSEWNDARSVHWRGRRDRGKRSSLTG